MKDFFDWLSSNEFAGYIVVATFAIVILSFAAIYLTAFFQGRAIEFWPPKIGPILKAEKHNKNTEEADSPNKEGPINYRLMERNPREFSHFILSDFLISDIKIPSQIQDHEYIRISISGLYRIKMDGLYLLVKGRRIDQYQPVGGVFKRFRDSRLIFEKLNVLDDDNVPIDAESRDDLRIRVPFNKLSQFLNWYKTGKNRETSPWREFYEELIGEGILSQENFPYINYEHIRTHLEGIHYTPYFRCHEILIAEIYELLPTQKQIEELEVLIKKQTSEDYIWASASIIQSLGVEPNKSLKANISKTSSWIL
jgi:hypothetical protein